MKPSSEELEELFERMRSLSRTLTSLKGTQALKAELITEIKAVSRDWLRISGALHSEQTIADDNLQMVDVPLKQLLEMTNVRTRSSSYARKLAPVISLFTDRIVVPMIRYEGSPSQVAARQLARIFAGLLSPDEQNYVDEAARCLASQCNRAAIILLWAAGIARFHSAIENLGFNAFNSAVDRVSKRNSSPFKYASRAHITSLPELQRCRDFDLIVVGMEIWEYDLQIFEELERLLGTRNGAAHPGMMSPLALDVQQFASKVKAHIFSHVKI
jgi:hypothetical protein